jgi:hypothetical protein
MARRGGPCSARWMRLSIAASCMHPLTVTMSAAYVVRIWAAVTDSRLLREIAHDGWRLGLDV